MVQKLFVSFLNIFSRKNNLKMIKKNDNFFFKIYSYFYKIHLIDYYFIYLGEQIDFLILLATSLESLIFYKKISFI